MKSHSKTASEHVSYWQLWVGAGLAIAAIGFGGYGLRRYELENGGHLDIISVLYHTLQLFILHAPHLEHSVPWQLHVGRLLGAIFVFAAAAKAFGKIFRDEIMLMNLRLPWRRQHVVVCGLGELGLRLALAARNDRRFVVAIEKDPTPEALAQARSKGVLVLEGDAREEEQLQRAHIQRAEFLVAACEADSTNIAIASLAGGLAEAKKAKVSLTCQLLIKDQALRNLVSEEEIFKREGSDYRVNTSDLEFEATAARQAFRAYPLDFEPIHADDDTEVHLVVIGFGKMGQRLARQAARIGHFANEVGSRKKRLFLTVVDAEDTAWNEFLSSFPKLQKICEANHDKREPRGVNTPATLAALCSQHGTDRRLVTYAFCLEDRDRSQNDYENLRLGLELSRLISKASAQVLIRQSSDGYASLFPKSGARGSAIGNRVHAFGMEDEVFGWDGLFYEDQIARAMHENYRATTPDTGLPDWCDLNPTFQDSNRQAADHVQVKLRAIDCEVSRFKWLKWRIKEFDHEQMDLLSRLEHARWSAERFLDGWDYGSLTDRARKINECLVPWENLSQKDRRKDWSQIQAIPKILKDAGLYIYKRKN